MAPESDDELSLKSGCENQENKYIKARLKRTKSKSMAKVNF